MKRKIRDLAMPIKYIYDSRRKMKEKGILAFEILLIHLSIHELNNWIWLKAKIKMATQKRNKNGRKLSATKTIRCGPIELTTTFNAIFMIKETRT